MWRFSDSAARSALVGWGVRHRYLVQAGIDSMAWAVALLFATIVRWNLSLSSVDYGGLLAVIPLAALSQVVAGLASGLYTGRWRFGSFEEVAGVARASLVTTLLLVVLDVVVTTPRMVPLGAVIGGGVSAFVLMCGARYVWRLAL